MSARPDVTRMGAALDRPDHQRQFPELGTVIEAPFTDAQGALVARVHLFHSDMDVTAAVAVPWAGVGYGAALLPDVDDKVVCLPILGLPDAGWVIASRFWEASTPAPAETRTRPDALVLARLGQTLRLAVQGVADLMVEARNSGLVRLGLDSATDPVALQSTLDAFLTALDAAIQAQTTPNPPGAAALTALKTALDSVNFPTCAAKVVAV